MSGRAAEIIEAVLLLHDLGKPAELIGSQLDLTAAEVQAVIKTKRLPATQKNCSTLNHASKKTDLKHRGNEWFRSARFIRPASRTPNKHQAKFTNDIRHNQRRLP